MNNYIESYSLSEIIKRYEKDLERSKLGGIKKFWRKHFTKKKIDESEDNYLKLKKFFDEFNIDYKSLDKLEKFKQLIEEHIIDFKSQSYRLTVPGIFTHLFTVVTSVLGGKLIPKYIDKIITNETEILQFLILITLLCFIVCISVPLITDIINTCFNKEVISSQYLIRDINKVILNEHIRKSKCKE